MSESKLAHDPALECKCAHNLMQNQGISVWDWGTHHDWPEFAWVDNIERPVLDTRKMRNVGTQYFCSEHQSCILVNYITEFLE